MQVETAQMLFGALASAQQKAAEAETKLAALEAVLKKRQPSLFQAYVEQLQEVRRNGPAPSLLSDLISKLVED